MSLPPGIKPATFGCAHGSGFPGWAIRRAQLEMTRSEEHPHGDREASWAGHCVWYIGEHNFGTVARPDVAPAFVEARYPRARICRASSKPGAIWATGQPLTDAQRGRGVAQALAMVGERYDLAAYGYFAAKLAGVALSKDLTALFTDPHICICSGVVAVCERAMGVELSELSTAAITDPDFISPADVMRWGLGNGWMSRRPGEWS